MSGRPAKRGRGFKTVWERRVDDTLHRKARHEARCVSPKSQVWLFRRAVENEWIEESDIGRMNVSCDHCKALHFAAEAKNGHFNTCCHNGLLILPEPAINETLAFITQHSEHFLKHIRNYNSAMAFASFSATRKEIPGTGPYCFKVQGQIHRYISDLLPLNGESPLYGQLYFIDSTLATHERLNRVENVRLNHGTLEELSHIMAQNPYAVAYRRAAQALEAGSTDLNLRFVDQVPMNKRRFNKPSAEEIAGVFCSNDGEPPGFRHVVIHHRENGPKLLSVMSPHCDPMVYPLLFPHGEPGWDSEMTHNGPRKQKSRMRITLLQFTCYRLAVRAAFSHIHHSKKLFQQYVVDCYVKVEGERLHFVRLNQMKLRVEHYKGLQDFVLKRAQIANMSAGKIVILPSSFEGSPRNMVQRYQDAMAIVRRFGKPDLFITMTCNPRWPEILAELGPKEQPCDRPDIVSRVFRCKFNEFKKDILVNQVLGVVVAHVYVIEFQKRGLPHAHMLLFLDDLSKFREPFDIDKCVSAELPDPQRFPRLHNTVVSLMIHGPCGKRNPNAPCMVDGTCAKGFPKPFSGETVENENGYPKYRRRDNGIMAQKNLHLISSRDVVPYNPYLLLKYNAHINVEICSSIRSVKYLFKYVYKGYDSACMEFVRCVNSNDNELMYDETIAFANFRYVSAHECFWRLHENEMHEQSHTIERLAVHEPDYQNVYFQEGNEEHALLAAGRKNTSLTAWFHLNKHDINANQFLYSEIPQHYRFHNNKWNERLRGGTKVIGRIYSVAPSDVNRFYLRMLLLHVKGAKSFEDLRTHNETTYETYKEAAASRGLLQDNSEWRNCLMELESVNMPCQLREAFAYICCFCEPLSPQTLWEEFKSSMIEDLQHFSESEAENEALKQIDRILRVNGLDCRRIGLPIPSVIVPTNETSFDHQEQLSKSQALFTLLNEEQLSVVRTILASASGDCQNKLFFLEAPGGCGKTFVYSCILSAVRGQGHIALAAAWTGIAALLLEGGTTLHRLFGLPVPVVSTSVSNIKPGSAKAQLLREAAVVVIDEASMIPAAAIDCIDRLLRDIMKSTDPQLAETPMGGKTIIFGGDFRQVLPVVPKAGKALILESCFQRSRLWKSLKILHLTQNMRTLPEEKAFSEWLLQLGNGELSTEMGKGFVPIPKNLLCTEYGSIVSQVFGQEFLQDNAYFDKAIVCPLNEDCHELNRQVVDLIEGANREYSSADALISDDPAEVLNVPLEYLNSITPPGLPPHKLNLKVGVIVMLIRNLNIGSGLVNGVRLVVRGLKDNALILEILTGNSKGNIIFLPRIKLLSTDPNMPFSMSRTQFPLRLAFAMTINKAQGQTFTKIGIYLPKPVFAHGQLYVAFSRARSAKDVTVLLNKDQQRDQGYTTNIVYQEIIQSTIYNL